MAERVYTLGRWRVREGKEGQFIAAWEDVGKAFLELPTPPQGKGTLVQSINDPLLFYSFGEWPSLEAVQAMRENAAAQQAIKRCADFCLDAAPGTFRVVAEA